MHPHIADLDARRGFAHVETWVFDLDNTLYPHHLNLWQQVDERIRDYISRFLKITKEDAFRLQKDYYKRYGTSMRGMMSEHGMDPDDFLEFVHQIDHSPLVPNPTLGDALEQLPGRKLILTNGTRKHAGAVLSRLRHRSPFRGRVRHRGRRSRAKTPCRRSMTVSSSATASIPPGRRCSRIWPAISKSRTRSA